ncbi:MAG: hypothetical protein Q9167_003518 [Letrouitia subvulpina]
MDSLVPGIKVILGSSYKGSTPIDIIKYRRLFDLEWSSWFCRSPDENPSKIYHAFKALVRKIFKRSIGRDAIFLFDREHWIAVPVEEGNEDTVTKDEFCIDEGLDEEEKDDRQKIDAESSEED